MMDRDKSSLRWMVESAMRQYLRNNRWGTCVDCPRDGDGAVLPELCKNTERYDHQITGARLAEMLAREEKERAG